MYKKTFASVAGCAVVFRRFGAGMPLSSVAVAVGDVGEVKADDAVPRVDGGVSNESEIPGEDITGELALADVRAATCWVSCSSLPPMSVTSRARLTCIANMSCMNVFMSA